jgi:hypothetical protein
VEAARVTAVFLMSPPILRPCWSEHDFDAAIFPDRRRARAGPQQVQANLARRRATPLASGRQPAGVGCAEEVTLDEVERFDASKTAIDSART